MLRVCLGLLFDDLGDLFGVGLGGLQRVMLLRVAGNSEDVEKTPTEAHRVILWDRHIQ